MPKLNDSQLVILSTAANRDSGAVLPLPKSFKGGKDAATKAIKALLSKKLLQERPVETGQAIWREAKDATPLALFITDTGLKALGLDEPAKTEVSTPRGEKEKKAKPQKQPSKINAVVSLLQRKQGATIEELTKATGWQPHSVRGAISGTLKKKMGLTVTSEKSEDRGRVYRAA